jgi:hypothetical protein
MTAMIKRKKMITAMRCKDKPKKRTLSCTMFIVRWGIIAAMASNAVPTVNQILRRRRKLTTNAALTRKGRPQLNPYEYDYVNGRAVPGDGRIDFNKAFPPKFAPHKQIALDSPHAKQMCWEEKGGSWGTI